MLTDGNSRVGLATRAELQIAGAFTDHPSWIVGESPAWKSGLSRRDRVEYKLGLGDSLLRWQPDLGVTYRRLGISIQVEVKQSDGGDHKCIALEEKAFDGYQFWSEQAPLILAFGTGMVARWSDVAVAPRGAGRSKGNGSGTPFLLIERTFPVRPLSRFLDHPGDWLEG